MARAIIVLGLLLLGGCVSGNDKGANLEATPSPSRYDSDPDKPKRVCEDSLVGGQPKTVCY